MSDTRYWREFSLRQQQRWGETPFLRITLHSEPDRLVVEYPAVEGARGVMLASPEYPLTLERVRNALVTLQDAVESAAVRREMERYGYKAPADV